MEPVSTVKIKKIIQHQASQWTSRMESGLSADERQSFIAWINADINHHKAINKLANKHNNAYVLDELKGIFPLEQERKQSPFLITYTILMLCLVVAFIASVKLIIDGSPLRSTTPSTHQMYSQTFQTMVGEQATYTLPDGSSLQLNTNSFVTVSYTNRHRSLALLNGEANFDVAKDSSRPFTVTVGQQAFTALGTAFNIHKANNEDMKLVVTEGTVLLSEPSAILAAIESPQHNKISLKSLPGVVVTAGQQASVSQNIASDAQTLTAEQLQQQTAWQQGVLIFNGEKLSDALKEISRYNNTHFEIASPQLANVKISGFFKAGDINGLLLALEDSFNIEHKKLSYHAIVLSRKNS